MRPGNLETAMTEGTGNIHEPQMVRFAIDQAPYAVFWMTEEAGFAYVNDEACRSLGYSREEFLRLRLWDIDRVYPKEQWSSEWRAFQNEDTAGFLNVETRHWRKDGTSFPVEILSRHVWFGEAEFHVAFARNITQRKRTQADLEQLKFAIDNATEAVFWFDRTGGFRYVNQRACEMLGYSEEELLNLHMWDIDLKFARDGWPATWEQFKKERVRRAVTEQRRKDGTFIPVEISASQLIFGDEQRRIVFVRDISERVLADEERKRLEAHLRQSQKMETIGRLAGGVAHDFNNMLSVILGYTELILSETGVEDSVRKPLEEIRQAAERSRDTTAQLLAFSRKQIIAPQVVDLNERIAQTRTALLRLIGEHIELRIHTGADLWMVQFDPSQIDQVLINLAVNARDAMPTGGELSISTSNVIIDEGFCANRVDATPGEAVLLEMSDSGTGMEPEQMRHIFEPFFTTKPVGEGTGLGLATVYGIMKQNGGFIDVQSELERGTTFRCYLPRHMGPQSHSPNDEESAIRTGEGTVLLVEDDKMVREMATAMLKSIGYNVLAASSPSAAIEMCHSHARVISLLISDVVMPGMGGAELVAALTAEVPRLKVLFMSGYASATVEDRGVMKEGVQFIQKPFTMGALAASIQKALAET
jgi:two-component system, cell cycle sensor histidine kinase and response regulator CckA